CNASEVIFAFKRKSQLISELYSFVYFLRVFKKNMALGVVHDSLIILRPLRVFRMLLAFFRNASSSFIYNDLYLGKFGYARFDIKFCAYDLIFLGVLFLISCGKRKLNGFENFFFRYFALVF